MRRNDCRDDWSQFIYDLHEKHRLIDVQPGKRREDNEWHFILLRADGRVEEVVRPEKVTLAAVIVTTNHAVTNG